MKKNYKFLVQRRLLIAGFVVLVLGLSFVGAQAIDQNLDISFKTSVLHTSALLANRNVAQQNNFSSKPTRSTGKILAQAFVPTQILNPIVCTYERPRDPKYAAEVLVKGTRVIVEQGENFTVNIQVKNTGNIPWFSDSNKCKEKITRLGTARTRDHESVFFNPADSRWLNARRIVMQEDRVNPGQVATFTYASKAPKTTDIFKEYFTPIVEGLTWIDTKEATVEVDVYVGPVSFEHESRAVYLASSGQTSSLDLSGPQVIEISIDQQRLWLKYGETIVREYKVSTGAYKTPTPLGRFKVLNKQDLRIGGASPHYRMPKWQGFTKWGHGLHALPYLANDRGAFWQEARDHIGHRVSHGCVRLLPEDAEDLYNLTEVGTDILIRS